MTATSREICIDAMVRVAREINGVLAHNDATPFLPAIRVAQLRGTVGWIEDLVRRMREEEFRPATLGAVGGIAEQRDELATWWREQGFHRNGDAA